MGFFFGIAPGTMTFLYVGVNLRSIQELITGKRPIHAVEIIFMLVCTIAVVLIVILVTKESKK